jgi:hypothetical protein
MKLRLNLGIQDLGVANSWGPSFNEGAQSGFILSYRSAFIPETTNFEN